MPGVHAVLTHDDVPGAEDLRPRVPPTSRCSRSTASATSASRSRSSRPSTRSRRDARPSGSASSTSRSSPSSTPSARPSRSRSTRTTRPPGHGYRDDPRPNVVRSIVIRHGDPDAEGDVSVAGVYELGIQDQAFLGPESGLAVPDGEGGVDVYVATQWLHVDRDQVAPCLGLEPEQVRIHLAGVGGAFGGREDLSMQIHGAMLALHTNRPVKIVYSREESFVGHVHRHPAKIWAEHRATARGRLVCVRVRILLDGGAYASSSAAVTVERGLLRVRSVPGRQRADRVDLRLHEQPALRRDARLRRRAGLLRARGADGQARGRTRDRPGRAAAAERARPGRHAADRPADHRLAAGRRGDPPCCGAAGAGARGAAARPDPAPRRCRQHDARRGRAARRRLRGRLQERLLLGGLRRHLHRAGPALAGRRGARGEVRLRRGRGGAGRDRRHPPGRAHRARHRDVVLAPATSHGSARRARPRPRG